MLTSNSGNSLRSRLKQYESVYKTLDVKYNQVTSQLEALANENLLLNQENALILQENSLLQNKLDTLLLNTEREILKIKNIDRILSNHWEHLSQECYNCNCKFGIFNRKHHCRKCGNAMCSNCTLEQTMSLLTREFKVPDSGFQKFKVCKKCL